MRLNKGDLTFISGGSQIDNYERIQIYQIVSSGTTGNLVVPKKGGGYIDTAKYDIFMDAYSGGQDALCVKTSGGYPIDEIAKTASGTPITVALSGADNSTYTLSGTPVSYDVALVFQIFVGFSTSGSIDENYILLREQVAPVQSVNGDVGNVLITPASIGAVPLVTSIDKELPTFNGTTGLLQSGSGIKMVGGKIYTTGVDGTNSLGIYKQDGATQVVWFDTTNGRVGINKAAPFQKLHVGGYGQFDDGVIVGSSYGIAINSNATKITGAGLSYLAGGLNIKPSEYFYQAASPTADTVNDTRFYNNAGTLTFQKCTVANATKGGGTWVNIGTM